jgi:predicted PurR-regulated permease PerM
LAEYCRARLLVALAKGLIAGSVLFLFQTPAAYTLGLVVGAASLLPVVGPLLGLAFLLIVAFPFHGPLGLALAGFLYLGTEILEGYVLLPRLVGRRLGLDDFAVILTVLVGGALLGIFGMLIAIPALVVVRVIYQEILRPALHAAD